MTAVQVPVEHNWNAEMWDWPLQHNDGVVKVINTPETFEVGLEVASFTPKEIQVRIMGHDLIVDCLHEEKSDKHGIVSRSIHRAYKLQEDIDAKSLKSQLTPHGILSITASKKHD